ncbi:hypothetical protein K438DRAFT_1815501 [Mycena galopus ATCC 62051]|nr:hypothetical protein K438DRAFT_1815501 [Mycena galopus ATCC 62051]
MLRVSNSFNTVCLFSFVLSLPISIERRKTMGSSCCLRPKMCFGFRSPIHLGRGMNIFCISSRSAPSPSADDFRSRASHSRIALLASSRLLGAAHTYFLDFVTPRTHRSGKSPGVIIPRPRTFIPDSTKRHAAPPSACNSIPVPIGVAGNLIYAYLFPRAHACLARVWNSRCRCACTGIDSDQFEWTDGRIGSDPRDQAPSPSSVLILVPIPVACGSPARCIHLPDRTARMEISSPSPSPFLSLVLYACYLNPSRPPRINTTGFWNPSSNTAYATQPEPSLSSPTVDRQCINFRNPSAESSTYLAALQLRCSRPGVPTTAPGQCPRVNARPTTGALRPHMRLRLGLRADEHNETTTRWSSHRRSCEECR